MRRWVSTPGLLVVSVLLVVGRSPAEAAPQEVLALVGGKVVPVGEPPIVGGTVLIRGDRIEKVGRDLPLPPGAKVIDCRNKWVTPGLTDLFNPLGLVEISAVEESEDSGESLKDPVRSALSVEDSLDLRSTLVRVARRHGITSVVVAPVGGLLAGRSAWVDLVEIGADRGPALIPKLAMHANLGELGAAVSGGTRAQAMLRLRELFDDADVLRKDRNGFRKRQLYELSASRLDLLALEPVLAGKMPLVVQVSRASDIEALLDFAQKQKLKVILAGAEEGWLVADRIARAKVPVVVNAFDNLPHRFESRASRSDNAALLARAGVKVAIATGNAHNSANLRFILGNAVRAGLPEDLALRAATLTPAEILGTDGSYGSLTKGRIANVVVWTQDPFEPQSHAELVLVRGVVEPTSSRQTMLAERYKRRLGL